MKFDIPLESTCYLFVAYCHEFFNRESYDEFVVSVKKELQNLLFDLLIIRRGFENVSDLSSSSLSQR